MSRIRVVLIALAILIAALAWWIHSETTKPPEVPFAKARRGALVSTLTTNGKVEPQVWVSVRAERAGTVSRVAVRRGQQVAVGALLVELDSRDARAEVASAEAALDEARTELGTLAAGGTAQTLVDIENSLQRERLNLNAARQDYESLKRLMEKQAATKQDVTNAEQKVQAIEAAIQALDRRRAALVSAADRATAEAKLREAQAALEQARVRLDRCRIQSPIAGTVYDLPVREGSYLNAGDLAADVGNLRELRVRVYVDEPELGRVAEGMPVNITWDAMPGKKWNGVVEHMPTQIVALGTRQVGEVTCTIENPGQELLPGTNVNAEIVSQSVAGALTIPKEAIRRENNQVGVYALRDGRLAWQQVKLGASSVTRAVVTSGLAEGELVALIAENPLHNGERVTPELR